MIVEWLFLVVPWVCLHFVIVVFPDHTHYFCKTCLLSLLIRPITVIEVIFLLANMVDKLYKQNMIEISCNLAARSILNYYFLHLN